MAAFLAGFALSEPIGLIFADAEDSQGFERALASSRRSQRARNSPISQLREGLRNTRLCLKIPCRQFVEFIFATAPMLTFRIAKRAKIVRQNFAARVACIQEIDIYRIGVQASFRKKGRPRHFVNRMAIRNNAVEIENDSLQHGDKMNEFPNLLGIGLRHALTDRAEDSVRRAKVRVFNVLHIVRRHDEAKIGQRLDATARKTGKNKGAKPEFARLFQAQDDVWRITAAGNCENGVSFFSKARKLLGENIRVRKVVGERSNQRHVVRQRDGSQALAAGGHRPLSDVTRKMRGKRRTAAIAKNVERAVPFVIFPDGIGHLVDHRKIEVGQYVL